MKPKTKKEKKVKAWAVLSRWGFYAAYNKDNKTSAEVAASEITDAGNNGEVIPCTITYEI